MLANLAVKRTYLPRMAP